MARSSICGRDAKVNFKAAKRELQRVGVERAAGDALICLYAERVAASVCRTGRNGRYVHHGRLNRLAPAVFAYLQQCKSNDELLQTTHALLHDPEAISAIERNGVIQTGRKIM
jgi:hypothetical protein